MKTRGGWSGCLRLLARLPEERVWVDFSLASAIAIVRSPLSNSGIERRARGPVFFISYIVRTRCIDFLSQATSNQGPTEGLRKLSSSITDIGEAPRAGAIEEQRMGSLWTKMSRTLIQKKISKESK
jgi:hypothetical protein